MHLKNIYILVQIFKLEFLLQQIGKRKKSYKLILTGKHVYNKVI